MYKEIISDWQLNNDNRLQKIAYKKLTGKNNVF